MLLNKETSNPYHSNSKSLKMYVGLYIGGVLICIGNVTGKPCRMNRQHCLALMAFRGIFSPSAYYQDLDWGRVEGSRNRRDSEG